LGTGILNLRTIKLVDQLNMKRSSVAVLAIFSCLFLDAQPIIKVKKYPSLLWEISGNGTKKPSYLIGTMHVSSKLAFHLADSFYIAIKNAEVVALETNPESWQEDMSKYDFEAEDYSGYSYRFSNYSSIPSDYISINTLKFYKYDKKIERSLYSSPSTINNLLYRTYGNESSDFEEDTYLDMYIFQCGKKWGKRVAGVENYGESMKLMAEAYTDAARDKNKKSRSYDREEGYSIDKIQEAYRTGNLDLLDSINKYNSFSDAFDEKFLYKRNEIQANSIDSIIRSGSILFVGVGAAHLPGNRGVIELLRQKGYKLRPVRMGERDSKDKEQVDKIRVPVTFKTTVADDGLFKVDIPGKFYKFGDDPSLDQKQYADMANGSYYMVTRIMTNAWMWANTTDMVFKTVDSLLYENIPGKIISKTAIIKNGLKGFDITNRTRRGDLQRYNIFITPFEVIFFKMSGNGDYVKYGDEARKFFGSIQFKEYKNGTDPSSTGWKKYSPAHGGFSVDLPHEPYVGNDGSWIYDSEDKTTGIHYRVIRTDIHNYHFAEEDSFDLGLMNESFMASEFMQEQLVRKQTTYKGYPALDGKYKDKNGRIYLTRFIIQGPHYYALISFGKDESPSMQNFLNSFEIKPLVYRTSRLQKDTSLYYTVNTPVFPEDKKIRLDIPRLSFLGGDADEEESEHDQLESGAYRNKVIENDTTGEKIYVSFYRSPRYYYTSDSLEFEKDNETSSWTDSTWIVKSERKWSLPGNMKVWETKVTDTGSSRLIWVRSYYKDGVGFSLITQTDTLTPPSDFVKQFFESFTPADTLKGVNPFVKKSNLFFEDFMSRDSVLRKKAMRHINDIELDSSDLPQLKKAIASLNWNENKYLEAKKTFIGKLDAISGTASADYLKQLYYALDDTVELQYVVLESLLQQQTGYAFNVFRDIVNTEPPVLDLRPVTTSLFPRTGTIDVSPTSFHYNNGNFLDELFDSLELTRTILPDLLPLLNLQDYQSTIMTLLGIMIDKNLVQTSDYDMYFSKFLIEAKQELKKQSIAEKKKAIEKARESKESKVVSFSDEEIDYGNEDLALYATLLLPYWDKNVAVQPLIQQMLRSNDKRLKYNTLFLLLRNQKPYPDSLLLYFGSLDEYRYELYRDLKEIEKKDKFPARYNNHLDLGKSALLETKTYEKPDTLVFIDRLHADYKGKKGWVYFYKYKARKDDLSWKLAVVGLIPDDSMRFEFSNVNRRNYSGVERFSNESSRSNRFDFAGFGETRLKEDEPIKGQLQKSLKKILYSARKSAKEFYMDENDRSTVTESWIDSR
jgi:uncharacterized protein YbaP (TraB family)